MISEKILSDNKDKVFDSEVYIEYFNPEESQIKTFLRENIFTEKTMITIHGHYLIKSDIYYILCRSIGREETEELIQKIERFINFISGELIYQTASRIKYKFPIVLSDCFSIATGIFVNCPIIFLEEQKLSEKTLNELNREFGSKIILIS